MILVCHPADREYAERVYLSQEETLVTSERCPRQVVLHLADRLKPLVESGSWFEHPPRTLAAELRWRPDFRPQTGDGKQRCQAQTRSFTQCRLAAQAGGDYCKAHLARR